MNDITRRVHLFGLTGSLRRGSYATAILRGLAAALSAGTPLIRQQLLLAV